MKILYIDHYAGSLKMGMEFRPYYFAREWKKMGYDVRVVGGSFSHLRNTNPRVLRDLEIQEIEGVEYQWIKTLKYNNNGVKRALSIFEFCFKLSHYAKAISKDFNPDIVISSSTYPLDTYPAQKIKKLAKAKYVHEAHDLWPLTLIEVGGMRSNHPFCKVLAIAEKSAFKKSDAVVGVAPNQVEYMLKHGLQTKEKFSWIPNGIALEDWDNACLTSPEHKDLFRNLKEQGSFIICYLGGHAVSNALDVLIDAAKEVNDKRIEFVLVGNGLEKERLQNRAKGANNIHFLPPISKDQVPALLQEANALYIGAAPCSLYRYGVSMNKVYDYMMAGKPIIYGVDAYNNDVLEFNCGITFKPNSKDDLIRAINDMMVLDNVKREEMGENGRNAVMEHYQYKVLSSIFASICEKLIIKK